MKEQRQNSGSHPVQQCPARQVVCFKCNHKVHFRKQCLSKAVGTVTENVSQLSLQSREEEPDFYLDKYSEGTSEKSWMLDKCEV